MRLLEIGGKTPWSDVAIATPRVSALPVKMMPRDGRALGGLSKGEFGLPRTLPLRGYNSLRMFQSEFASATDGPKPKRAMQSGHSHHGTPGRRLGAREPADEDRVIQIALARLPAESRQQRARALFHIELASGRRQMPSMVEVEAAARAAYRAGAGRPVPLGSWDRLPEEIRAEWRRIAYAVLDAAERVREILAQNRNAA